MLALSILSIAASIVIVGSFYIKRQFRKKNLTEWLPEYYRQRHNRRYRPGTGQTVHILFCVVDHFEPLAGPTKEVERERMRAWVEGYPRLVQMHKDSTGRPPQHTWFYPGEQYDEVCLEGLAQLVRGGYGEIELHLHHGYDIPERLRRKLQSAIGSFSKHGALMTRESRPRAAYGFIHGNMALNNSNGVWNCGVDNELAILKETGCYADFSFPTAPCRSQSKKINAIYYATDTPGKPKSHDDGEDVEVARKATGDLMIIQGPLAVNWRNRKYGIIPRIENGEIQESNPPTPWRIKSWITQHIHVKGRPEWVVVKISCHGAEDRSRDTVLGQAADQMYSMIESQYRDRPGFHLHYVTARELYNIIKAAEAGERGDPSKFRDYVIPPYQCGREQS